MKTPKEPLPPARGWSLEQALDPMLGGSRAHDFYGSAVDELLLRHVMRRPDLCFTGRPPLPAEAERMTVPRELYNTGATFKLSIFGRRLEIIRPFLPVENLVDVRIEQVNNLPVMHPPKAARGGSETNVQDKGGRRPIYDRALIAREIIKYTQEEKPQTVRDLKDHLMQWADQQFERPPDPKTIASWIAVFCPNWPVK